MTAALRFLALFLVVSFATAADSPRVDLGAGPAVVHLHCGDDSFTRRLLKSNGNFVVGLDTDAAKIAAARLRRENRKHNGTRLLFRQFDGKQLPFINNSVNFILSTESVAVSAEELHRVLVPGGRAVIRAKRRPTISDSLASISPIESGIYRGLFRLEKKWPTDTDEWTHHMHGPDNNRVAKDTRLAPPLSHLQWSVGPKYTRHHEYMSSFQAMVSAQGRIFYIIDEGKHDSILLPPDWKLVARDAFNGILLWERPLTNWFNHLWPFKSGPTTMPRRLVVKDDRLFAALAIGEGVSVLDANDGRLIYELPDTDGAEEIIVDGDRLFVVRREWLTKATQADVKERIVNGGVAGKATGKFNSGTAGRQSVMVFNWVNRRLLWQKETPVAPFGIGVKDEAVYVFDGESVIRRHVASGKEIWNSGRLVRKPLLYSPNYGCNLVIDQEQILVGSAEGSHMLALSTRDGKELWRKPQYRSGRHAPRDLFLIDDKAWTTDTLSANMSLPEIPGTGNQKSSRITGYDLKQGAVASDFYPENELYHMNARCHMSCATENFLITSRTGTELVSLTDEKWHIHHWIRGACLYGLMPANGIIYAPPNPCACYTQSKLNGFNAVTGFDPRWQNTFDTHQGPTFVRGPAKSSPAPTPDEAQAWPVYRHDNNRSGSTRAQVKLPLHQNWRSTGYENLTGLVVANRLCIFAEKDRHTLHALDADTGKPKWTFIAGGRIDSPPSVAGPSLFFGCADGWLYHLRAADGELVWKRRLALADLSLFVRNQPESLWPMSGSVLVQDGRVYCVSGRSAFLDGGLRLAVVDAKTGDLLFDHRLDERDPESGEHLQEHIALQNMPVALPDLLSSDGKHIYMLTQQFDLDGKRTHIKNAAFEDGVQMGIDREHIFSATGFLDENWFHRTYWVYGNSFLEGCSMPDAGWFEMGRISPSGKMLCFDDSQVYGYGQFPEYAKWSGPLRYSLFAVNKTPKNYNPGKTDEELRKPPLLNWRKWRSARLPEVEFNFDWKRRLPVRAKSLIKTADTLFVAGPEDLIDEEVVFDNARSKDNQKLLHAQNQAIRSSQGGKLTAISVNNGGLVQTITLDSGPVWDGMAVAYGKVYIAGKDGSIVALANNGATQAEGYQPEARQLPKAKLPTEVPPRAKWQTRARPVKTTKSLLTKIGGQIAGVSSFQSNRRPEYMIDGNPATFWHTRFTGGTAKPPHHVILLVPNGTKTTGLTYTAWTGGNGNGHVKEYAVSVSTDGRQWTQLQTGSLQTGTSETQTITFPTPTKKPYIKFQVTASQSNGRRFLAAIGELDVIVANR